MLKKIKLPSSQILLLQDYGSCKGGESQKNGFAKFEMDIGTMHYKLDFSIMSHCSAIQSNTFVLTDMSGKDCNKENIFHVKCFHWQCSKVLSDHSMPRKIRLLTASKYTVTIITESHKEN